MTMIKDIFNLFNKGVTCPICGGLNNNRKCRANSNMELVWCREDNQNPEYTNMGLSRNGEYFYRLVKTPGTVSSVDYSAMRAERLAAQQRLLDSKPTDAELSNALSILVSKLSVADIDKRDLLKRGLTEEQIASHAFGSLVQYREYGIKGIPGFLDNGSYVGASGLLCPIYNLDGNIQGFQVKTNIQGAKYTWTTTKEGENQIERTKDLKSGETPITFINKGTKQIGICEGVLKPIIAAERLGISMIGAAGGHFNSSKMQLQAIVDANPDAEFILFPDKNSISNVSVRANLKTTIDILLGMTKMIGVAYDGNLDCDEVDCISVYTVITADRFLASMPKDSDLVPLGDELSGTVRYTNKAGVSLEDTLGRMISLARQQGFKHILFNAPPGAGKTHAVANYISKNKSSDILYYAKSQHAPDHSLLRELPRTPRRNTKLRANEFTSFSMTENNCHWTDKFTALYNSGVNPKDLCQSCPFVNKCAKEGGDGYGFKKQFQNALKHSKLLTTVPGFQVKHFENRKEEVLGFYEEAGVLPWSLDTKITAFNIASQLTILTQLQGQQTNQIKAFITTLQTWFNVTLPSLAEGKKYGVDVKELYDSLADLAGFDTDELSTQITNRVDSLNSVELLKGEDTASRMLASWLPEFFGFINGDFKSVFTYQEGCFLMKSINDNMLACIARQNINIYMDATLSKGELSLLLSVGSDEILELRVKDEDYSNIKFTQIQMNGNNLTEDGSDMVQEMIRNLQGFNPDKTFGLIDTTGRRNVLQTWDKSPTLGHYSDARGSNAFQTKDVIIAIGDPRRHIGAELARFCLLTKTIVSYQDSAFKAFLNDANAAEMVQEIGRLRSERRSDQNLEFILFSNKLVSYPGITFDVKQPESFGLEVKRRGDLLWEAVKAKLTDFYNQGIKPTQRAIAAAVNCTEQTIRNLCKRMAVAWGSLVKNLSSLVVAAIEEDAPRVKEIVAQEYPELNTLIETEEDIQEAVAKFVACIPKQVYLVLERFILDKYGEVPNLASLLTERIYLFL
jgi:DNA polymerase III delta prime subunit